MGLKKEGKRLKLMKAVAKLNERASQPPPSPKSEIYSPRKLTDLDDEPDPTDPERSHSPLFSSVELSTSINAMSHPTKVCFVKEKRIQMKNENKKEEQGT